MAIWTAPPVPDSSVDFLCSQAELEHIRAAQFTATMKELERIMRINGVASLRVHLKDHPGGSLNNMRIATDLCAEPPSLHRKLAPAFLVDVVLR